MQNQESTRLSVFLLLIFSLFISLYYGENSSGGSKLDNQITRQFIDNFYLGIFIGLEYFIDSNQVQSPFFYIIVSFLERALGVNLTKLIYILISSIIPLIFYVALRKKFPKIFKSYLFYFSLIIFLSPYFRSSSVWITTDNFALLFFILSINEYLSYQKTKSFKKIMICLTYLSVATYTRQYYIIFFIFYFIKFFSFLNIKKILGILTYLSILFLPYLIYYYLFFSKNFTNFELEINQKSVFKFSIFSNILIFLSLYFFYTLPFYFNSFNKIITINIKKISIILVLLIFFLIIGFFDPVNFNLYGGGIFYKISTILGYDILFYISAYLGLLLLLLNLNFNNFIIYICIIFLFPVALIYQKYFDPLLILTLTTITTGGQLNEIIEKNKLNLITLFLYFGIFLIASNIYYR